MNRQCIIFHFVILLPSDFRQTDSTTSKTILVFPRMLQHTSFHFFWLKNQKYCNLSPGLSCSELSRYECNTGACIDSSLACDYSDDCLDLSDELGSLCASFKYRCDFEHGLCSHWTEEVVDNANWILLKASADPLGTLPNGDHTHSTSDGESELRNWLLLVLIAW